MAGSDTFPSGTAKPQTGMKYIYTPPNNLKNYLIKKFDENKRTGAGNIYLDTVTGIIICPHRPAKRTEVIMK